MLGLSRRWLSLLPPLLLLLAVLAPSGMVMASNAPDITSSDSTTFTVGQPGSFTVVATGTPTPGLSFLWSSTLPAGVSFSLSSAGTATLSGTPAPGTVGTYQVAITASNGVSPEATQTFTLTVTQAPSSFSAGAFPPSTTYGNTVSLYAAGLPSNATGTVTFTAGGITLGTATVHPGQPQDSCTSAVLPGGTYDVTATYSGDGNYLGATANTSFTVTSPPTITSDSTATFTVGQPGSFPITTTGSPAPAVSESGTLPTGVSLAATKDGTYTLSGTPAPGAVGTYQVAITAYNGVQPDATQSLLLTVNQAPSKTSFTAASNPSSTTFGNGVTLTATGLPQDATGTVTFTNSTTGATLGKPAAVNAGAASCPTGVLPDGTYDVTATYSGDAHYLGSTATTSFAVTGSSATTITSENSATFTVGQAGSFTVTTLGFPTPSISVWNLDLSKAASLPPGLTFQDNGDGTATLSGTPGPGAIGTWPMAIMAISAGSPAATQTFTLQVAPKTAGAFTASATPPSTNVGNQVILAASGLPSGATGTVTFTAGNLTLGTATVDPSSGTARCRTSTSLGVGTYQVIASYSGDQNYGSSTAATTFTLTPSGASALGLTDIAGSWAQSDIEQLVALGAITGFPDGTFRPNTDITRAEFVTVLVKALKLPPETGPAFEDTQGTWAQVYIATATAYGLVTGYDSTHFGPNAPITREQMAAIMVRAAKLTPASAGTVSFKDRDTIDHWALPAVVTAVQAKLMDGYPNGTFNPLGFATRAQAATVIARLLRQ